MLLPELFTFDKVPSFNENYLFRAKTAPVKNCKSFDDFKKSTIFLLLEKALNSASVFLGHYDLQFNIENPEEQVACKTFLSCVEDLHTYLCCVSANRDYRLTFSKAYLILYKESKLCYLTEILDSAQECRFTSCADVIRKRRKIRLFRRGDFERQHSLQVFSRVVQVLPTVLHEETLQSV